MGSKSEAIQKLHLLCNETWLLRHVGVTLAPCGLEIPNGYRVLWSRPLITIWGRGWYVGEQYSFKAWCLHKHRVNFTLMYVQAGFGGRTSLEPRVSGWECVELTPRPLTPALSLHFFCSPSRVSFIRLFPPSWLSFNHFPSPSSFHWFVD